MINGLSVLLSFQWKVQYIYRKWWGNLVRNLVKQHSCYIPLLSISGVGSYWVTYQNQYLLQQEYFQIWLPSLHACDWRSIDYESRLTTGVTRGQGLFTQASLITLAITILMCNFPIKAFRASMILGAMCLRPFNQLLKGKWNRFFPPGFAQMQRNKT